MSRENFGKTSFLKHTKNSKILLPHLPLVGPIEFVEPYNENCFGNVMTESDEGRKTLNQVWQRILETMRKRLLTVPLSAEELTAAATSFSLGLDEKSNPANEELLLQRFVAYLRLLLDEEVYNTYVPADVSEVAKNSDGRLFGKPVWDFSYPESSFFITEDKFIGCSITSTRPGDVIYVARGSTYPLVLRPEGEEYQIRGFAYVHGLMHAERQEWYKDLGGPAQSLPYSLRYPKTAILFQIGSARRDLDVNSV